MCGARYGIAAAAALALCSCGPRRQQRVKYAPPASVMAVAEPAESNRAARAALEAIERMYPHAERIPVGQLPQAFARLAVEQRILIIPDPVRLPMETWAPLRAYLDEGGTAVFLGRDPFRARAFLADGALQTESRLRERLLADARAAAGFSDIAAWQHLNDAGAMKGSVRLAPADRRRPWPGVTVEAAGLARWDAMVLDGIPRGTVREGENTLAFYARGDARTSELVLIAEERDGGAWYATVPLTTEWQAQILHEAAFHHAGRATPGKNLSFARIRKMSVGLFVAVSPQEPGDHRFEISDLRLAVDPRPPAEASSWPDIPMLSPPCRAYDFYAPEVRPEEAADRYYLGSTRMQGPFPGPRGWGGQRGSRARWIPVFTAFSETRRVAGWPASIFVEPRTNGTPRRWAWIGMDADEAPRELIEDMVAECVSRLHAGVFLFQSGCDRFALEADGTLEAHARWTAIPERDAALRVAAELIREGDSYPARRVVMAPPQPGGPAVVRLGRLPEVADEPGNYIVRVSLEDANQPDRVFDYIEQPVKVLPPRGVAPAGPWISTSGARFTLGGRPLFLLGFHYAPMSLDAAGPRRPARWLSSSAFDPDLVRRDLAVIESIGINTIAVDYREEEDAPQLRFLLDEATRRGLWVYLALDGVDPVAPDVAKVRRMIEAADLKNQPRVWAIAVASDPRLGRYSERRRLDAAWRAWLMEQFESIRHAEEVLGRPVWRDGKELTGPSDAELATDGPHRGGVALYRRFVDDLASRQLGRVTRAIREAGCRQLLTLQTGFLGTGSAAGGGHLPLDPAAGAAHLDFAVIQANELHGSTEDFQEAGFLAAYARGVMDGKPVAWFRFGTAVGRPPSSAGLKNQARICNEMFELALRTYAAAAVGWRYTPGECPGDRGDYGLVGPDGQPRPAAAAYRDFAHRLRTERDVPATWQGREIHRDADARGLPALWAQWKKDYAEAVAARRLVEVRPAAYGRRTGELLLRPVGGESYVSPAPIDGINSEWGRIEVDGRMVDRAPGEPVRVSTRQRLKLELINTGAAVWDGADENQPRTVWVAFDNPRGGRQLLPLRGARFGEKVSVTVTVPDPGVWRLRPQLLDVGPFGEGLEIEAAGGSEGTP